jgi:hypothetical protein
MRTNGLPNGSWPIRVFAHSHTPSPRTASAISPSDQDRPSCTTRSGTSALPREVPPEAYRRFLEDFQKRSEMTAEIKAGQLALHEARERFVAEWVSTHATADQRDRYAQGMLPLKEVLEALGDVKFAAAGDRPRYMRDTVAQLQTHLRRLSQYTNAVVTRSDFVVTTAYAEHATEAQSAFVQELQTFFPTATVRLLFQRMSWKQDPRAPALNAFFALVTQQVGPFLLRREYVAPAD